jgi:hypothetical protein
MANLSLATPILPQRITIRSQWELDFHVHEGGQNFNWNGWTPRAVFDIGAGNLSYQVAGTVLNQSGGTARILLTSTETGDFDVGAGCFGEILLYARNTAQTVQRAIAVIPFQIAVGDIP